VKVAAEEGHERFFFFFFIGSTSDAGTNINGLTGKGDVARLEEKTRLSMLKRFIAARRKRTIGRAVLHAAWLVLIGERHVIIANVYLRILSATFITGSSNTSGSLRSDEALLQLFFYFRSKLPYYHHSYMV
jgi:hypothetical protein